MFALSLILSICFATYILVSENLKLIFFVICILMFLCAVIVSIIFKRKFLVILSVVMLLFAIPIGQMYLKQKTYNKTSKYAFEEVVINGRICENIKFTSTGNLNITLDSIEIVGPNYRKTIDGRVSIYTNPSNYDLSLLEIGRFVSTFGKLNVYGLGYGVSDTLFYLSRDIVASSYVSYSSFEIKDKVSLSFAESVRKSVYQKLQSFDLEYADIGYAMMFGDSSTIDDDVVSAFRSTGIAHLLAVSGLHVSIIAMIISFILKLLKSSNRTKFAVMSVLLVFYMYLCDFSVSVVRASIMTMILLYLKTRGKCYDGLSALAFSAIVILLANPLKLYNVSFILSFMAVLSIMIISKSFETLFDKAFHKKMSSTFALLFAVLVGLTFVQLYFFKKYSLFSIACNFVSVPVATIAFIILIIGTIVASVLPFMTFVCLGYDYLMGLIVKFNYTVSKIGLVITINNLNFLIIVFGVIMMVLASNFVFVKKRYKAVGISLFAIVSLILLLV